MNPELPPEQLAEFEARLTAYLLGELPAHKAAALRQELEENAELAKLYDRLKPTIKLVEAASRAAQAEAAPAAPLKLSADRREKLLAQFKTIVPKEFAEPSAPQKINWMLLAACAVIFIALSGLFLPALAKSKSKAMRINTLSNLRELDMAKEMWAGDNKKGAEDAPTFKDLKPYLPGGKLPPVAGERYLIGKVGESASAEVDRREAKKLLGVNLPSSADASGSVRIYANGATVPVGEMQLVQTKTPQEMDSLQPQSRGLKSEGTFNTGSARSTTPLTPPQAGSPFAIFVQPADKSATAGKSEIVLPASEPAPMAAPALVENEKTAFGLPTAPAAPTGGVVAANGNLNAITPPVQLADTVSGSQDKVQVGVGGSIQGFGGGGGGDNSNEYNLGIVGYVNLPASNAHTANNVQQYAKLAGNNPGVLGAGGGGGGIADIGAFKNDQTVASQIERTPSFQSDKIDNDLQAFRQRKMANDARAYELKNSDRLKNVDKAWTKDTSSNLSTLNSATLSDNVTFSYDPATRDEVPMSGASTPNWINKAMQSQSAVAQSDSDASNLMLAYQEKQEELKSLTTTRDLTKLKVLQENVETKMPNTTMVEIVERAETNSTSNRSLSEKVTGFFTGTVERRARIKSDHDVSDISGISGNATAQTYDPHFVQSEVETIQSKAVLDKVIEKLDLKKVWADKGGAPLTESEARARLKKSLDVRPEKNSSLVDIGVKSDNPVEAANIANALAVAVRDFKTEQRSNADFGKVKQIEVQLAEQDLKVARTMQELAVLKKQLDNQQKDLPLAKSAVQLPIPMPEILTRENAFSTFSLNVADVSFKLAEASLDKGVMPDAASIRSEEFINAFDYRDPDPAPGAPLGFAWERAHDPFAHNRDLLRFSVKTAAAGRPPGRALNIVLLLDNSGSMERADRVQIIHEALRVLATQLQPQDKLSIVTFARTPRLWVDGVPGDQAGAVFEKVSGLTPQGGTNLEDAMRLAYETARRHYLADGVNRVVLLTDGAANLGNVDATTLRQKVEANRKQGIALDCFGIGWEGYNDDLLEALSRNGDGRYGFLNTPAEAASDFAGQLAGALNIAAADVKVQVEFNPKRVKAYRQIGYAKHQLTKQQFRDNSVDAAEIGAAESGNALYVVETDASGEGAIATVHVRFRVPGTSEYREHAWEVPYNGSGVALDQASPAMRLAASAGEFAEWLANSPYAAEVTPDQLLRYLAGVPQTYGADARPAKLEEMIREAKSISGK
ncbi:MAG TPA: von Willebrand factor type A domain-containing protein [Verrucomicrobiae bacterium]|nr:von Willebrand factor type A domain-containing protein [Verrucomicrobiae bacterium]